MQSKNTRIMILIHTTVIGSAADLDANRFIVCFKVHHREDGDYMNLLAFVVYLISIHTTVKVVTDRETWNKKVIAISIHTTAKVVTQDEIDRARMAIFQSTPPRRW